MRKKLVRARTCLEHRIECHIVGRVFHAQLRRYDKVKMEVESNLMTHWMQTERF